MSYVWIVTINHPGSGKNPRPFTEKTAYDNEHHATRHYKYEKSQGRDVDIDRMYVNQVFE